MKIIIVGIVGFLIASSASAGTIDRIASTVVYLYEYKVDMITIDGIPNQVGIRKTESEQFVPKNSRFSGTGFFVATKSNLFLVTAAHVARGITTNSFATVSDSVGKPKTVSLRDLTGWEKNTNWIFHETSDVAIARLNPVAPLQPLLAGHSLDLSVLESGTKNLSRDISLTVIGFPLSFGANEVFAPLSRETSLASGIINDRSAGPILLLQDPSVGGYSGAPVFDTAKPVLGSGSIAIYKGHLSCLGLISGTLPDNTGGKLALVIPSSRILDLITK